VRARRTRGGPCPAAFGNSGAVSSRRFRSALRHCSPFCRFHPAASQLVRATIPVAPTPQSQAHRRPFAQDWNNDSKNQQSRPKHHPLGRSGEIAMAPAARRTPSTETCRAETMQGDACNGAWRCCRAFFLPGWNKFNNPSVDHCRPRTMLECAASSSCALGVARHIQGTANCGPMVAWPERRNPKAPLPHEMLVRPI